MSRKSQKLSQKVYSRLREALLTSELLPGHKLSHQDLTELLGVSHTPVREALSQLAREGYVRHIPNRGYFVADSTRQEVEELLEVREALEIHALKQIIKPVPKSLPNALRSTQSEYRQAVEQGSDLDRLLCDRKYHLTLAGFIGNRTLIVQLGQVFDRINLKRRISGLSPLRGRQAVEEHENLISALKENDLNRMRLALERHLKNNKKNILERIKKGVPSLRPIRLPRSRPIARDTTRNRKESLPQLP